MARPVTFLSDYGLTDEFVGVVHGVLARLCPEARVIDLTHGIRRHDVLGGALALARALPYTPAGVHLAVVDPEVGARRRAVALRTAEDDRLLVGPDNGLLLAAAERFGGVVEAVEVSASPWRLEPVSATFHGRDLFAPVAARLAAGEALAEAGEPVDPADLVALDRPSARREADGTIVAHAVGIDVFGNVALDLAHGDLAEGPLRLGRPVRVDGGDGAGGPYNALFVRTFADVDPGALLVYEDAGGSIAVAVNSGDAAAELGIRVGDEVRLG
jgi:S-adenosylmethionine hydrolase